MQVGGAALRVAQEAQLAAEELAWDNKMNSLRQSAVSGPPPGNLVVEHTEDEQEVPARTPILAGAPVSWQGGWRAVSGCGGSCAVG